MVVEVVKRYRVKPSTWFCVECAKQGRRSIVVPVTRKTCPFGHKRKAGK